MKHLLLFLFGVAVAGCVSNVEPRVAKSDAPSFLPPSSVAKLDANVTSEAVRAQAEVIDAYRVEWNNAVARSFAVSEIDRLPQIIETRAPTYPPDMHLLNKEATVLIDFIVDRDGTVISAFPVDVSAQPFQFTASAIVAVWNWRFLPGLKAGKPVMVRMQVPIVFRIE